MALETPTAGGLRHLIHFERDAGGAVVGGETTANWTVCAPSRNANVAPTRGGDEVIAGRLEGKVGYDIWVRYDALAAALKAGDRAVNDRTGEVYTVGQPIDPTGRRQWLLIQAESTGAP